MKGDFLRWWKSFTSAPPCQPDPWVGARVWIEDGLICGRTQSHEFEYPIDAITLFREEAHCISIGNGENWAHFPPSIVEDLSCLRSALRHAPSRPVPIPWHDIPVKYRCMTMRRMLEEAIEDFADPELARREWLNPFIWSNFDFASDVIVEDLNYGGSDEPWDIYSVQTFKLRSACQDLGREVLHLYKTLGDVDDRIYLDHPHWPEIVARGRAAREALIEDEASPAASSLSQINDLETRGQIRAAFARWSDLPFEDFEVTDEEKSLFASLENPFNLIGKVFAHEAEAFGALRVQFDLRPSDPPWDYRDRLQAHAIYIGERMIHADQLLGQ